MKIKNLNILSILQYQLITLQEKSQLLEWACKLTLTFIRPIQLEWLTILQLTLMVIKIDEIKFICHIFITKTTLTHGFGILSSKDIFKFSTLMNSIMLFFTNALKVQILLTRRLVKNWSLKRLLIKHTENTSISLNDQLLVINTRMTWLLTLFISRISKFFGEEKNKRLVITIKRFFSPMIL